jgi:hypothetical protein
LVVNCSPAGCSTYFAPYVSFVLLAIAALEVFLLAGAASLAVGALAAMCIGSGWAANRT